MHVMFPFTKGHVSNKAEFLGTRGVSLLEGDYCTVKPVLTDQLFLPEGPIFQYSRIFHQRQTVFRDKLLLPTRMSFKRSSTVHTYPLITIKIWDQDSITNICPKILTQPKFKMFFFFAATVDAEWHPHISASTVYAVSSWSATLLDQTTFLWQCWASFLLSDVILYFCVL